MYKRNYRQVKSQQQRKFFFFRFCINQSKIQSLRKKKRNNRYSLVEATQQQDIQCARAIIETIHCCKKFIMLEKKKKKKVNWLKFN